MQPLRVLIAPDKFKGTLTAQAAAEAIARGWASVRRSDRLTRIPIADGGDGFGAVLSEVLRGRPRRTKTMDAAHRPCKTTWWWQAKTRTAIVESAQVIGLAMLPRGKYHPFELDTLGLGILIEHIRTTGAKKLLIGIGGSATNDGGFGLARALGWRFLRRDGAEILVWTQLGELERIQPPRRRHWFQDARVAVDVQNRLLGRKGASRVYGPQKGLRIEDFALAEKCLRKLAETVKALTDEDFASKPGAGAAGGLGFALPAFLGAKLEPGFELLANQVNLDAQIEASDLVITGEGSLDESTLMGKGVGQLARRCRALGVPCVALAGTVSGLPTDQRLFCLTRALTEIVDGMRAQKDAAVWLEKVAADVATRFTPEKST